MGWLEANKEWLFDGALVAIPIAIIGWIIAAKQKNKTKPKIAQKQKSGDNSLNIQIGGDFVYKEEDDETKTKNRR